MAPTSSFSSAFLLLLLLTIVVREIASQQSGSNSVEGEWNYDPSSPHGPEYWRETYPTCGGLYQSPINIPTVQATFDSILTDFSYTNYDDALPSNFEIKNTGSSIQVYGSWTSAISGGGLTAGYKLSQLHFHWGQNDQEGSEHLLDDKSSALEIHLVHWNEKYATFDDSLNYTDGVAVLAVFVQVTSSSESSALGNLTAYFDEIPHPGNVTTVPSFDLKSLLPEHKTYYRYKGSLTTPACQESVTWTVFHDPIYLNEKEIAAFRTINGSSGGELLYNFRPPQAHNGRVISTSIPGSTAVPNQPTASATVLATLSVVMAIVTHNWLS